MINFVQLQDDVTLALESAERLASINIVQYRKLRLQSEIDWSSIWQTVRNGRSGGGLLVEMPTFEAPHPNLPGPDRDLTVSVVGIEEPNLNFSPATGTLLSCEEFTQIALEELHQLLIEGLGGLYAAKTAFREAPEFQGVVAYRASLFMRGPQAPLARVALPTIIEAGLNVTLATTTAGATIFYTLDGTFPGPANPGAMQYLGAFDMVSGQTVRWAAYLTGLMGSHIGQAVAP